MVTVKNTVFQKVWPEIVDTISLAFGFTEEERARFSGAPVARLVGATPFVAGCEQPLRTALSHLATLVVAARCRAFLHEPADASPYARLALGLNFIGGDESILRSSRGRLGLRSYANHEYDADYDRMTGKFNPIVSGDWDSSVRDVFLSDATCTTVPEFDKILPVNDGSADPPWWF